MTRRGAAGRLRAGGLALLVVVAASCAPGEPDRKTGDDRREPLPTAAGTGAPRDPVFQRHWRQAWSRYERGDRRGAVRPALSAIEAEPGYREAYQLLSHLFVELGDDPEAARVFGSLARAVEGQAAPWYFKGFHEFRLNLTGEAEASFARAVELDPEDAESRYRLGLVLLNTGEFALAHEHLARAWELDGRDPMIAGALAEVLRVTGRYDEVERVATEGLARAPGSAELRYHLARVWLRQGRLAEAEDALRQAILRNPFHQGAHFHLAQLLLRAGKKEGRWEKLVADRLADYATRKRLLTVTLASRPDDPSVALRLGELELSVGKADAALPWLDRAEHFGGAAPRIAAARAAAHFRLGDLEVGEAQLQTLGNGDEPGAALARVARGLASGDGAAALELLGRAVRDAPRDRVFLRRAASLYERAGLRDEAAVLLTRAADTPVPPD